MTLRTAYIRGWASRLMEENSCDRQIATSNIPGHLNQEHREEIADWIRIGCYGERGGPHCLCGYGDDERHPEEKAYAVSVMLIIRAKNAGDAAHELKERIATEETLFEVVNVKDDTDRHYIQLDR